MARHRMTAARRAALRKAQKASARKRRRKQYAKAGLAATGVFAGAVATKRLNKYADNPRLIVRDFRSAKTSVSRVRGKIRKRRGYKPNFQQGPWV